MWNYDKNWLHVFIENYHISMISKPIILSGIYRKGIKPLGCYADENDQGNVETKIKLFKEWNTYELPSGSPSPPRIACRLSASKLFVIKLLCVVCNGGFLGCFKDWTLFNSAESLLSGGAFWTSKNVSGLSESGIMVKSITKTPSYYILLISNCNKSL